MGDAKPVASDVAEIRAETVDAAVAESMEEDSPRPCMDAEHAELNPQNSGVDRHTCRNTMYHIRSYVQSAQDGQEPLNDSGAAPPLSAAVVAEVVASVAAAKEEPMHYTACVHAAVATAMPHGAVLQHYILYSCVRACAGATEAILQEMPQGH